MITWPIYFMTHIITSLEGVAISLIVDSASYILQGNKIYLICWLSKWYAPRCNVPSNLREGSLWSREMLTVYQICFEFPWMFVGNGINFIKLTHKSMRIHLFPGIFHSFHSSQELPSNPGIKGYLAHISNGERLFLILYCLSITDII